MQEQEYIRLIENNILKEHIMPIYNAFEKYIENEIDYSSISVFNEVLTIVQNESLGFHLSEIRKVSSKEKSSIMKTYVASMQRNIADYKKVSNSSISVRTGKLKKLLCSYINVSRYVIDYEKLEQIISAGPRNGEKIILAIGLVSIEDDDIKVNDEINYMVDSVRNSANYFVIPIYGCSTNVFSRILQKVNADIVHIAGHGIAFGRKKVICFTDSNMTYSKLCEKIASRKDLIFLNCCNTYEFVNNTSIPIATKTIVHEREVDAYIALQFSRSFYEHLWISGDVNQSWNVARNVENPLLYHYM